MKKYLQFFSTLFVANIATAQVYQPFPTNSAIWREKHTGLATECTDYQYTITGDTIVNDLTYHKLQKTGVSYIQSFNGLCTGDILGPIDDYAGCFREDIEAKKVYFLYPTETIELLLYDFNLQVGDTVPSLITDQQILTVSSIDSVLLNGIYHKRYAINNCDGSGGFIPLYFMEGVGGTYGLLRFSLCPFEDFNNLLCFSVNEQLIYNDPDFTEDCVLISVGAEENKFEKSVLLYPIPANDILKIKFDKHKSMATAIGIFNALGTAVKSQQIVAGVQETSIDLSDLADGIYFAIIKQGSLATTKKVVKCAF
jgi:Secretion system C-terminal sorting domain